MNNTKNNILVRNEGVQAPPEQLWRRKARPVTAAGQPPGTWIYPSSTGSIRPRASLSRVSPRKRRIYADYRELLALEPPGRKLNFLGLDSSHSPLAEPQPQSPECAPGFQEHLSNETQLDFSATHADGFDPPIAPVERLAILVVDQRMNMFFGSQRNLKSVVAVNAAALIAWRVLSQGIRLGAIVFNDRKIAQFCPGCSRLHTLLILQNVLGQNHSLLPDAGICSNPRMLNNALRRAGKRFAGNAVFFLITDGSGCDQETLRLATNISQQNNLLVTLVYDPQQAGFARPSPPDNNDILGKPDPGTDVGPPGEKNFSGPGRQRLMTDRLFPEGIPVIPLNTRDSVAYQLRRAFAGSISTLFTTSRGSPAEPLSSEVKP